MAARLAVVCVAALVLGCGNDGGGGGATFLPLPQWARARSDTANSGSGVANSVNQGLGSRVVALGGGPIVTTPVIGIDGNVFVATADGSVVGLDADLEILWRLPAGLFGVPSQLAVDAFDNVYLGTADGVVASITEGVPNWTTQVGSAVTGSPLLIVDLTDNTIQVAIVGTADGRVLAIGGPDGQIRWQRATGGAVRGSLAFDTLNLYAASAADSLFALTTAGMLSYPAARLGPQAGAFAASPALLAQTIAVTDLDGGGGGGRVRGFSAAGLVRLWDALLPDAVSTPPTLARRAVTQVFQNADGTTVENIIAVTDFLVVDRGGQGWLIDSQLGGFGTRCIGGPDDQRPCRSASDCDPGVSGPATCQPIRQCVGGTNAGQVCRSDQAEEDCPGGACTQITQCAGGDADGNPCSNDDDCPGGACNLSIFSVDGVVDVGPVATGEGTILVTAETAFGGGVVYAVDLPGRTTPIAGTCVEPAPALCRFAFQTAAPLRTSPSVAVNGTIYLGDDAGIVYAILDSPE